jgi:hypothetical protein
MKLWLRPEELVNPNRLLQTEDFEDAAWINAMTVTSGHPDPFGGNTAFLITSNATNSGMYQNAVGVQFNLDDAASLWLKRGPSHNGTSQASLRIYNESLTAKTDVPPVEWARWEATRTSDGDATYSRWRFFPDTTTGSQSIYIWHPQLESGITASPYKANAATAGGIIASWPDQSGYDTDANQSNQAKMLLVLANALDGYSAVLGDGVDDSLISNPSPQITQPNERWVVARTVGSSGIIAGGRVGANRQRIGPAGTDDVDMDGGTAARASTDNLFTFGDFHLVRALWKGASSELWVDGVQTDMSADPGTDPVDGVAVLAGETGGGNYCAGAVVEIVDVNAELTGVPLSNLLSYFQVKFPSLGI